jgi:glucose-6-phosphate isomerase
MSNNIDAAWSALEDHIKRFPNHPIGNKDRFNDFHLDVNGILIDYSRQHLGMDTVLLLCELARQCGVEAARDAMFAGDIINTTENRPVLHTALRRPRSDSLLVDGSDVVAETHKTFDRMQAFVESVHNGMKRGHSGKPIDTIVHIGIGGSALGPEMVVAALEPYHRPGLKAYFISNIDGTAMASVLGNINPETTLFLIASKTFTTIETMTNAHTARDWLVAAHGGDSAAIGDHFVALTAHPAKAREFGVAPDRVFPFHDGVGGRYSLWSSIGLPIALMVGMDHFYDLLGGAHDMDMHFRTAPMDSNAPVLLAMIGIWNRNLRRYPSLAVLPYDQRLTRFPAWLQQTDMESNGKAAPRSTAPVVFGEPGTDCQHSFFQLLHQGTDIIPCDFIGVVKPHHPYAHHHRILMANMVAQADALARGAANRAEPHRHFPGGRPSTIILLDRLDPAHLGRLLALYEHKVFVQGFVWGIYSFDQFGVELGKIMANRILETLKNPDKNPHSGVLSRLSS